MYYFPLHWSFTSASLGQVFLPCDTECDVDLGEAIWLKLEEQSTEACSQLLVSQVRLVSSIKALLVHITVPKQHSAELRAWASLYQQRWRIDFCFKSSPLVWFKVFFLLPKLTCFKSQWAAGFALLSSQEKSSVILRLGAVQNLFLLVPFSRGDKN